MWRSRQALCILSRCQASSTDRQLHKLHHIPRVSDLCQLYLQVPDGSIVLCTQFCKIVSIDRQEWGVDWVHPRALPDVTPRRNVTRGPGNAPKTCYPLPYPESVIAPLVSSTLRSIACLIAHLWCRTTAPLQRVASSPPGDDREQGRHIGEDSAHRGLTDDQYDQREDSPMIARRATITTWAIGDAI
jgi:hypothetical protein